jgi:hypothetical protein
MRVAWTVLLVSAFTDFLIAGGGAYVSAVVAYPEQKFNKEQVFLFLVVGTVAAARTIQQALKSTPEGTAGSVALTSGVTASKTTITGTTETKTEAPPPTP